MMMLKTWTILFPLWSYLIVDISMTLSPVKDSEIARRLLQNNYDKSEPPPQVGGSSTNVRLGIYVNSFNYVDDRNMEFGLVMYIRQAWNDPRLDFSQIDNTTDSIRMPEDTWDKIWIPDLFIRNAKSARFHEVPTQQKLFRVKKTGDVWYVIKLTVEMTCSMNQRYFPHDSQTCLILFESYGYKSDTLTITALDTAIDVDSVAPKDYIIVAASTLDCSQNYTAGTFPCLEVRFLIQRHIGYIVIQVYLPSILLVIVSWIGFWIDREAIAARMMAGLACLITLSVMGFYARFQLLHVSYITSFDVWMIVCHIFIFATLVEYAVVSVLFQNINPFVPPKKEAESKDVEEREKSTSDGRRKALTVDWFSRFLFPSGFLLFNLIYWISSASIRS